VWSVERNHWSDEKDGAGGNGQSAWNRWGGLDGGAVRLRAPGRSAQGGM